MQETLKEIENSLPNNFLCRKIEGLSYPSAKPISEVFKNDRSLINAIRQINLLGRTIFLEKGSGESDFVETFHLKNWILRSPSSWLVHETNGKIDGYAHVEIINDLTASYIIKGKIDESEIESEDILNEHDAKENSYIHIGTIARDLDIYDDSKNIGYQLLASAIKRILYLWENTGAHRVLAVSYPDRYGKYHFEKYFKKYHFQLVGKDKGDNEVYLLDLKENSQNFRDLSKCIILKELKHLKRQDRIEGAKKVLTLLMPSFEKILRSVISKNISASTNSS